MLCRLCSRAAHHIGQSRTDFPLLGFSQPVKEWQRYCTIGDVFSNRKIAFNVSEQAFVQWLQMNRGEVPATPDSFSLKLLDHPVTLCSSKIRFQQNDVDKPTDSPPFKLHVWQYKIGVVAKHLTVPSRYTFP